MCYLYIFRILLCLFIAHFWYWFTYFFQTVRWRFVEGPITSGRSRGRVDRVVGINRLATCVDCGTIIDNRLTVSSDHNHQNRHSGHQRHRHLRIGFANAACSTNVLSVRNNVMYFIWNEKQWNNCMINLKCVPDGPRLATTNTATVVVRCVGSSWDLL